MLAPDKLPTREQFDAVLAQSGVPAEKMGAARRAFYRKVVQPSLKSLPQEQRAPYLSAWTKPATGMDQDATSSNGPLLDFGLGMARTATDESLPGRAIRAAARKAGLGDVRLMEPPGGYGEDVEGMAYRIGAAMPSDPTNVAPLGLIGKTAGPLKQTLGMGATNAAIGGTHSALGDVAEGRPVDWRQAGEVAATAGALGLGLGAAAHGAVGLAGRMRKAPPVDVPDEIAIAPTAAPIGQQPPRAVGSGRTAPVAPGAPVPLGDRAPGFSTGYGRLSKPLGTQAPAPAGAPVEPLQATTPTPPEAVSRIERADALKQAIARELARRAEAARVAQLPPRTPGVTPEQMRATMEAEYPPAYDETPLASGLRATGAPAVGPKPKPYVPAEPPTPTSPTTPAPLSLPPGAQPLALPPARGGPVIPSDGSVIPVRGLALPPGEAAPLALPKPSQIQAPPVPGLKERGVRSFEGKVGDEPRGGLLTDPAKMSDDALLGEWRRWQSGANAEHPDWLDSGTALSDELGRRGFQAIHDEASGGVYWGRPTDSALPHVRDMSNEALVQALQRTRKEIAKVRADVTRGENQLSASRAGTRNRNAIGNSDTFLEDNTNLLAILESDLHQLKAEAAHRRRMGMRPGRVINPANVAVGALKKVFRPVEEAPAAAGSRVQRTAEAIKAAGTSAARFVEPAAERLRAVAEIPESAAKALGVVDQRGEFAPGEAAARRYDAVVQPLLRKLELKGLTPDDDLAAHITKANSIGRQLAKQGQEWTKKLRAELTPEQLTEAYRVLNDKTLADTPLGRKLEPLRKTISDLSREMVAVGSIHENQRAAWEGEYVKRLYNDFLDQSPSFARALGNKVKGSKSRGTTATMSEAQFEKYNQPWTRVGQEGGRVVLDNGAGQRISVPERKVGHYEGSWSVVRKAGDGTVVARRDWTPAEREVMHGGENTDAAIAVEATFRQFSKELRNGYLLRDIANDRAMAIPVSEGPAPEGWKVLRPVPKNQSGLPGWGHLADHYVRPDVYDNLVQARALMDKREGLLGALASLMRGWKTGKTVYNVASHTMNALQNMATLELNGGSVFTLPRAVRLVREDGARFNELADAGLFDDKRLALDLVKKVPDLGDKPKTMLQRLVKGASEVHNEMTDAYQGVDDIFRVALVEDLERHGYALADAVKMARERMFHANYNTDFVRGVADFGVPFVRVGIWTADEVPKMLLRHPGKFVKLAAMKYAWDRFAEAMSGQTKEETDARKYLAPNYQKSPFAIAQFPVRDTKGQPLHVDMSGALPWGPLAKITIPGTDMEFPIPIPETVMPGGPLAAAAQAMMNLDLRTGREIHEKEAPLSYQATQTGRYLWDSTVPGIVYNAGKVADAAAGKTDRGGRAYDVPTALANAAGLHVQPVPADAYARKMRGFLARIHELDAEIRRIEHDKNLSPEERAAKVAEYAAMKPALAREIQEFQRKVGPALAPAAGASF